VAEQPAKARSGRSALRRRRSGRRRGALSLAVAPLIDVVFLLLMYFLLVGEFRPPEKQFRVEVAAEPAQSAPAEPLDPFALPAPPVRVTVRSTGDGPADYTIRVDTPSRAEPESAEALRALLEGARGSFIEPDQAFLISATPDSRWEHTLAAFNAVLRAGYHRVRFTRPDAPP